MLPMALGTALPNLQPQILVSKHLLPVLKGSSREDLPELERVSSLVTPFVASSLRLPEALTPHHGDFVASSLRFLGGPTPYRGGCIPAYFTRGNWSFTCTWADVFQATAILLLAGLQ